MRRRSYLRLATVASAGLAGCTASALPGGGAPETPTPRPDCPRLLDADRTVCPRRAVGPLSVDQSTGTVIGADWSFAIAVTNVSGGTYRFDPYAWSVFHQTGDGWDRLTPDATDRPQRVLGPGDRFSWELTTSQPPLSNADQRVFLELEPGAYAFVVPFTGPDRVAAVGPFVVDGQR